MTKRWSFTLKGEDSSSAAGVSAAAVVSGFIMFQLARPSGYWLFGFASKKYHPLNDLQAEKWNELHIPTWYYTTNLHTGAFMLPKYVEDLLEEEENNK